MFFATRSKSVAGVVHFFWEISLDDFIEYGAAIGLTQEDVPEDGNIPVMTLNDVRGESEIHE